MGNSITSDAAHEPDLGRATAPIPAIPGELDIADVVRGNLLRLRQERGLSLDELARLSGVQRAALEDLASGRSFPGVGLLWKLAFALDIPCTAFVEAPQVAVLPMPTGGGWAAVV